MGLGDGRRVLKPGCVKRGRRAGLGGWDRPNPAPAPPTAAHRAQAGCIPSQRSSMQCLRGGPGGTAGGTQRGQHLRRQPRRFLQCQPGLGPPRGKSPRAGGSSGAWQVHARCVHCVGPPMIGPAQTPAPAPSRDVPLVLTREAQGRAELDQCDVVVVAAVVVAGVGEDAPRHGPNCLPTHGLRDQPGEDLPPGDRQVPVTEQIHSRPSPRCRQEGRDGRMGRPGWAGLTCAHSERL